MISINQNPEQLVRDQIGKMLLASGWKVQSKKQINSAASLGVAVRKYQTNVGTADYILSVNRKPVSVIEATKSRLGLVFTFHCLETSKNRNSYYPRIAVTVDTIATGTDIRPLEVLVFLRDIKSKRKFYQMFKDDSERILGEVNSKLVA